MCFWYNLSWGFYHALLNSKIPISIIQVLDFVHLPMSKNIDWS